MLHCTAKQHPIPNSFPHLGNLHFIIKVWSLLVGMLSFPYIYAMVAYSLLLATPIAFVLLIHSLALDRQRLLFIRSHQSTRDRSKRRLYRLLSILTRFGVISVLFCGARWLTTVVVVRDCVLAQTWMLKG